MQQSSKRLTIVAIGLSIMMFTSAIAPAQTGKVSSKMATVLLPSTSPLISLRLLFNTGAASDPKGKEGVASLTAAMISDGGTQRMTYAQVVEAMYPMATRFNSQVDKEMTAFYGTTHADNLNKYYDLIRDMVLNPGWREDDFNRLREDAINFLKVNLRHNNDEELGKEVLYNEIYEGHPYGHNNIGTVESLQKLTLEDVKKFYRDNYTIANLVAGLAGGFPKGFEEKLKSDFAAKLAAGSPTEVKLSSPAKIEGLQMTVIDKEAPGTAISLGFPIQITRAHPDWPALLVAQSYFGQHRSSNSYLYQRLRQIRGLNYGDYAYIEYFPRGMFQFHPDPNIARRQQIFQIWIRPVEPKNALFSLRAAMYELDKLIRNGMSKEDFEATREFLTKFVNVLTKDQDSQLGYALDSRYYAIPGFTDYVRERLSKLTLDDVNRAIKTYLQARDVQVVVVTTDGETFKKAALSAEPSPISYTSPPGPAILEEDKLIERFKLNFNPKQVRVVPVESVFQS